MKELSDTVKKISSLAEMFETITQQSLLDTKSEEAINGISCVFSFEDIKKLPLNREQRRKMPNNLDNPDIIRDVIKGSALQVIPIAIYQ